MMAPKRRLSIKKGPFRCLSVALPGSKHLLPMLSILSRLIRVPFADVPRSCTSTPSGYLYLAANMCGKVAICLSLPPQIMKIRLFSEYITGWAVFSLNMSLNPALIFQK